MKTLFDILSLETKTETRSIAYSKSLSLCAILLFVLIGTGCDSNNMNDAEPRVLSGIWKGSITHTNPDLNGTLTLTITQAGEVLGGTANWRFSNRGISGILRGNAVEEDPITYTLDFSEDGMYLHEATLGAGSTLNGSWVSARSSSITGTFSLQRQ